MNDLKISEIISQNYNEEIYVETSTELNRVSVTITQYCEGLDPLDDYEMSVFLDLDKIDELCETLQRVKSAIKESQK